MQVLCGSVNTTEWTMPGGVVTSAAVRGACLCGRPLVAYPGGSEVGGMDDLVRGGGERR